MSNAYFILRPLRIHELGGQFPLDPTVAVIGHHDGWYSATIAGEESITESFKLSEYHVIPTTSGAAYGWGTIGATVSGATASGNQVEATTLHKKLEVRSEIDHDVGDLYDVAADLEKRAVRSERLVMALASDLFANAAATVSGSKADWDSRVSQYWIDVANGDIINVYDYYTDSEIDIKLKVRGKGIKTILDGKNYKG